MNILDCLFNKSNYSPSDNWHEDFIVHLAQLLKPKVYVELGIYRASLFNKMLDVVEECYGVDHNPVSGNFVRVERNAHFYHMTTNEFSYELKHLPPIDMLFIDAHHSRESVETDFYNYVPYVNDQGIIFIHDTYPKSEQFTGGEYCGDGYKAIRNINNCRGIELMTIPLHPGLTIVRKSRTQVPWNESA